MDGFRIRVRASCRRQRDKLFDPLAEQAGKRAMNSERIRRRGKGSSGLSITSRRPDPLFVMFFHFFQTVIESLRFNQRAIRRSCLGVNAQCRTALSRGGNPSTCRQHSPPFFNRIPTPALSDNKNETVLLNSGS